MTGIELIGLARISDREHQNTQHEWGVETYEPFVVYHTFDNSSINFTVMLRTKEYFNRFFVKSVFIKALHQRFNAENIVIPFPITALNLQQEGADSVMSGKDISEMEVQKQSKE